MKLRRFNCYDTVYLNLCARARTGCAYSEITRVALAGRGLLSLRLPRRFMASSIYRSLAAYMARQPFRYL